MEKSLIWVGIILCLSQSAMFSGLNLALFSVSRLRLEVAAAAGDKAAAKVLTLRQDSNFLLTTLLWGNVGINVLLTLLSDSVMAGVSAFFFSTLVITFFGEITPQAYFSRHALRMGVRLAPLLRVYQWLLYPVARPTAWVLDRWLGKEGIEYFRERDLHHMIRKHMEAQESDIDRLEGLGAMNFLALDDLRVSQEGEPVDPQSIIALPYEHDRPVFPRVQPSSDDAFIRRVHASGKKWVIFTDMQGMPRRVMNANAFVRNALLSPAVDPLAYCHRPIVITDPGVVLGEVLGRFRARGHTTADDVIEQDVLLVWGTERRIITGTDLLGRLLRGIAGRTASLA